MAIAERSIPRSGEKLPIVGLGTWRAFDVGASEAERAPRLEVLRRLLAAGGRVVDSSPMYGESERVLGDLVRRLPPGPAPFLATKIWARGRDAGEAQMRDSLRRLRVDRLDLLQVHNLVDWEAHLPTMRAWRDAGRVRYLGITHYAVAAFGELERLLRTEALDFVQLPYSAATRDAEARLFPAARDTGTAVLVMRPLEEGDLLRAVAGRALPPWAPELGCTTWSQVLLKFVLSHPDVTAAIPATASPDHLDENVRAGEGPWPDEALRRRMAADLTL